MSGVSRLVCLDTVLVDVELRVSAFPPHAGDVRALEQLVTTGGGFNAMSAASRHHLHADYAGRLGTGPFSEIAVASLANEGIGMPIERYGELDTGICVVLVEPDGERTFITTSGAEGTLRASDLASLDVGEDDYVLVSGYNVMYSSGAEIVLDWLGTLSANTLVLFDPATRVSDIPRSNLDVIIDRATWLLCNADEAALLAEIDDFGAAAEALAATNDRVNVVVRQGADGCFVALNHAAAIAVEGFLTNVVDTNGAGDVHNGVFIAELASDHDALAAARWANAAAAIAVSRRGPATSPSREEVAAFIESSTTRN